MEELRTDLETRFDTSHTLPETRSFHHFAPMSEAIITVKRVSEEEGFSMHYNLVLGKKSRTFKLKLQQLKSLTLLQFCMMMNTGLDLWNLQIKKTRILKLSLCIHIILPGLIAGQPEKILALYHL